ncbi:phage/plasmid primase, P4 family [Sporomusa sphaeroides]|uniref:SF3 helicase domain-containing protein n=1 Tax=Sporomusa sphaeroides DSM 2875 TaxID=1337886 RepID=A0ABP2CAK8_9FIRM|nr:phage/plasmid primase, P4 family [Sporomusa sphaeroides]OLS56165.1 hypothetical protein SPSPH_25540 [Sporomusa sphaeroides DSM 2875]CVK19193.1 hypothetical protein SSPH_01842 [Sporomusa sphaeroides DSM 2875]
MIQGYILLNEKIPKHGQKLTDPNFVPLTVPPEHKDYGGVLKPDVVKVDIDNPEIFQKAVKMINDQNIKCNILETTRGGHLYFKNSVMTTNKSNCSAASGLLCEWKLGLKHEFSPVRVNGIDRHWLQGSLTNDDIDEIPKWLLPLPNGTADSFSKMEEGSGRNQALFNYILTLQSNDFSVEEIKETIRIINKYVLKTPLSDREVETILRDDSFKKQSFFRRTKFLHEKFAAYMKSNHHMIKLDGKLNIYTEGIYVSEGYEIEKNMIKHIPSLTDAQRREVLKHLMLICENRQAADLHLIAFKNGIYNVRDDSFSDFSPNVIITNKIDWSYNPAAYSKLADRTINKIACEDNEIRMLLEEVIGYTFYRRNELGKAFILLGDKQNGKSTYIDMIKTMLGDNNISALDLKNLSDRFNKAMLYKKMANLGDDIDDDFITDTSTFKKVVTGDTMQGENKGEKPFNFNPYCKLIFSANRIPKIKDPTGATIRRLIIIPFNAKFTDKEADFDPYIKYKLREPESIEYLILLGIQGLKRILQNRKFTISNEIEQELNEYEEQNNPVKAFLSEIGHESILREITDEVFSRFKSWCSVNSHRYDYDVRKFTGDVNKITGFKSDRIRPPKESYWNGKKDKINIFILDVK